MSNICLIISWSVNCCCLLIFTSMKIKYVHFVVRINKHKMKLSDVSQLTANNSLKLIRYKRISSKTACFILIAVR